MMKNITKIGLLLVVCTLLCISIVTATDNTNLPTKNEVNSFLEDMKGKSASEVMDSVKEDHSTWKADLLECSTCTGDKEAIALYYKDSESQKGYGSVYFKDGKIVSPSILKGYSTKESYKGMIEEGTSEPSTEDQVDEECKDGNCKKEINDSESKEVQIKSESKITVEDRKAAFMKFLETKDSVTLEEVQEELDKCFPNDMEA